ncbi:MAG: hypothetical protein V1872_11840, partial [bacterium]
EICTKEEYDCSYDEYTPSQCKSCFGTNDYDHYTGLTIDFSSAEVAGPDLKVPRFIKAEDDKVITTKRPNDTDYNALIDVTSWIKELGKLKFTYLNNDYNSNDPLSNPNTVRAGDFEPDKREVAYTGTFEKGIFVAKNKYEYIQRSYWDVWLDDDETGREETWERYADQSQSDKIKKGEEQIIATNIEPQADNKVKITVVDSNTANSIKMSLAQNKSVKVRIKRVDTGDETILTIDPELNPVQMDIDTSYEATVPPADTIQSAPLKESIAMDHNSDCLAGIERTKEGCTVYTLYGYGGGCSSTVKICKPADWNLCQGCSPDTSSFCEAKQTYVERDYIESLFKELKFK